MDDYMKEMMDLKTLVTKTLEKKGVLARIRVRLAYVAPSYALSVLVRGTRHWGGRGSAVRLFFCRCRIRL